MTAMTKDIFGKLFGDKGYISKALAELLFPGRHTTDDQGEEEHEKTEPLRCRRHTPKEKGTGRIGQRRTQEHM